MNRYLINFESAHWCGGDSNVVVNAESADEALFKAESHMEDEMRELFSDELADEPDLDNECSYTVNSVEEFDETHEDWQFYKNPTQSQFYPEVL